MSEESFDGDQRQDFDTTVSAANVAAVQQAVYGGVYFPWTQVGGSNRSFGPVNFKYLAEGGPALPTVQWVGVYGVSGNPTTILDAQTGAFAAGFYRALELAP